MIKKHTRDKLAKVIDKNFYEPFKLVDSRGDVLEEFRGSFAINSEVDAFGAVRITGHKVKVSMFIHTFKTECNNLGGLKLVRLAPNIVEGEQTLFTIKSCIKQNDKYILELF